LGDRLSKTYDEQVASRSALRAKYEEALKQSIKLGLYRPRPNSRNGSRPYAYVQSRVLSPRGGFKAPAAAAEADVAAQPSTTVFSPKMFVDDVVHGALRRVHGAAVVSRLVPRAHSPAAAAVAPRGRSPETALTTYVAVGGSPVKLTREEEGAMYARCREIRTKTNARLNAKYLGIPPPNDVADVAGPTAFAAPGAAIECAPPMRKAMSLPRADIDAQVDRMYSAGRLRHRQAIEQARRDMDHDAADRTPVFFGGASDKAADGFASGRGAPGLLARFDSADEEARAVSRLYAGDGGRPMSASKRVGA
jgi:hypothetical protein